MQKRKFHCKGFEILPNNPTILCGILNVTPDSFSDGGNWRDKESAIKHAEEMISQGAKMIDVGGESTRPGSTYVNPEEEIRRIIPVISELKKKFEVPISVDTWKSEVASRAIDAGADIINDITGFLGDPKMAEVVGKSKCGAILMFNSVLYRPEHPSTKIFPSFGGEGAFSEKEKDEMKKMPIEKAMVYYLNKSMERALEFGIGKDRIMLDSGIGFGLTKRENLTLLKNLSLLHEMGCEIFLGVSRKRFLVNIIENSGFEVNPETKEGYKNRDLASSYLSAIAAMNDVEVLRVHSVLENKMAVDISDSVRFAEISEDINFQAYKI